VLIGAPKVREGLYHPRCAGFGKGDAALTPSAPSEIVSSREFSVDLAPMKNTFHHQRVSVQTDPDAVIAEACLVEMWETPELFEPADRGDGFGRGKFFENEPFCPAGSPDPSGLGSGK
jgi:hypothetical protein